MLAGPPLHEWLRRRPSLGTLRFSGVLADETAYGAGVWHGCVRERLWTPLLPAPISSAERRFRMNTVVVVATIRPLPDHRAEVVAELEAVIAEVHAEEGCLLYALHEGQDRLVMIEKWSSQEALDRHARGPALAELSKALDGRLQSALDVQVLRPHPAGTPEQGVV